MSMPKAYEPEHGYQYQILTKYKNQPYEHCDYAVDKNDKDYLLKEYTLGYGKEYAFKTIKLPKKYWHEELKK